MKTPSLLRVAAFGLFVFALDAAVAAPITNAQFRAFRGRYTGEVSGIAGNLTGSQAVGPFASTIVVRSKRSEMLTPLISNLYSQNAHKIVWRKPAGTRKRAVLTGVYRGTFYDSYGAQYMVQGTRRLVLTQRTVKGSKRRVAQLSDDLRETFVASGNPLAAQDLTGRLRR